jgi:cytochrome c peroxidase
VVVARADKEPWEGGLLYGTPDLFLRLYSMEQRKARDREEREVSGMLLAMVGPPMQSDDSICADLACLVARGEKLFFGETFSGNGRTCGTCHPAENNLTIEPEFIAGLPDSDPLFIGEDRPNHPFPSLVFERPESFGLRFENPVLMRMFGLIVENLDGFASPISSAPDRFTMRGVPHVFAQRLSIVAPPQAPPPAPPLPRNRTGWSGDGSPSNDPAIAGSDGTLRFFAAGAVRQHFTKNILRRVNIDFVFPTDAQLTALEAFQLTLGRQQELNLATLTLLDPQAQLGKGVFTSAVGRCNGCHGNAGANRGGINENFNTGVERFLTNHPDGTGEQRPPDGGFGTNPQGDFTSLVANLDPTDGIFGNKQFNTPSLVEFADTLPGFHNNITAIISNTGLPNTVEGAVTFYTTDEFDQSPSGPRININATQIAQVGKFLRVINALENERSARDFAKRARNLLLSSSVPDFAAVNRLLRVAVADCTDAIDVLDDVGLHPVARALFNEARQKLEGAMAGSIDTRVAKIDQAVVKLDAAEADMKIVP